jgi:DNA-binding transcriptional MerR regulator
VSLKNYQYPEIPERRYFTIGEASDLCDVKPHVLRYWEQEFTQLAPVTRRGNRRYYQQKDVLLIRKIRNLLYEECYTISGAKQKLSLKTNSYEPASAELAKEPTNKASSASANETNNQSTSQSLDKVCNDLTAICQSLRESD